MCRFAFFSFFVFCFLSNPALTETKISIEEFYDVDASIKPHRRLKERLGELSNGAIFAESPWLIGVKSSNNQITYFHVINQSQVARDAFTLVHGFLYTIEDFPKIQVDEFNTCNAIYLRHYKNFDLIIDNSLKKRYLDCQNSGQLYGISDFYGKLTLNNSVKFSTALKAFSNEISQCRFLMKGDFYQSLFSYLHRHIENYGTTDPNWWVYPAEAAFMKWKNKYENIQNICLKKGKG